MPPSLVLSLFPPCFPLHRTLTFPSISGSRTRSSIDGLPTSSYSNSAVTYPALARHMSSHQRTQGYVPGAWGSSLPPAAPAFAVPQDNYAGVGAGSWQQQQGQTQANPHASMALGAARAAATAPPTSSVGYSTPLSPPPDPRAAAAQAKADAERADRERSERDERERAEETRRNGGRPRLRTVLLPHATLPRFLAIASVNTSRNLETCGLLLGREVVKGSNPDGKTRYVVETLLIPKQHATSDTCTMDEEESVLGFTEERGLITLGWIHTHPSQSCFMSSVDLHTHASFQCMLPESFAVVCAPKSDPKYVLAFSLHSYLDIFPFGVDSLLPRLFGIFRLTDPPGLQTVLKCTAKQAFHPHPDVPIYTDADKGHVQMRDAALEIVDLR
ncbi:MPN domain-containing protein [Mycena venus]|uniref:MPN domain-containing protein n=1 Tax=Mycena venus TaxID=2733690 RepID=A0A8H6X7H4_9AGAR|nr:MPN domain-containing protein [Mycena venus]